MFYLDGCQITWTIYIIIRLIFFQSVNWIDEVLVQKKRLYLQMMLYPLYTLSSCLITSLNSHWNLDWIEQRRFCFNFSCLFVKGTYVLQDNNFQLLTQMSDGKQYTEEARKVCRYLTRLKFLIYLPVVWLENRSGKKC